MASIKQLLDPQVLTQVISQQMAAEKWILSFMGMEPGGRNERFLAHGRRGDFNVFNNTRQIGRGRAPGTAAAHTSRQGVETIPVQYPRMHESVGLLAEELHNLGMVSDPAMRDVAGADMIRLQTRYMGQRASNWRAAMVMGMLRDELYVAKDGDDWYFNFDSTSSLKQISFNMPAGNRGQLDMLGAGAIIDTSWDNPNADIPRHLSEIDAAFQQLYGGRLENVILQGALWQHVIKNDHVASQAGIANTPFRRFERPVGEREDGSPLNVSVGELAARPGVQFYITDEGLDLYDTTTGTEVFSKYIGDNDALFMPSPDLPGVFSFQQGSEPIAEFDGGPKTTRVGLSSWSVERSNPTVTEIFSLDNGLAINHIPNSTAYATPVF